MLGLADILRALSNNTSTRLDSSLIEFAPRPPLQCSRWRTVIAFPAAAALPATAALAVVTTLLRRLTPLALLRRLAPLALRSLAPLALRRLAPLALRRLAPLAAAAAVAIVTALLRRVTPLAAPTARLAHAACWGELRSTTM